MRSPKSEYILTKQEVHDDAFSWLGPALRLEYEGRKCDGSVIIQILLLAAARMVSVFAACEGLADAPTSVTVFNGLYASVPAIAELERRLNLALVTKVPRALRRRSRIVAIDLTLIPYHGQPAHDKKELYRNKPKSGTTKFHAYATAYVVHHGYRYTLALSRVEAGECMKEVVQRLLAIVRQRDVKIRYLLLDKGFYSVAVITYLKRAGHGFIIPVAVRGRPKSDPKAPPTGARALLKKKNGYYGLTLTGKRGDKKGSTELRICVANKDYLHERTGKKRRKRLLYAIHHLRRTCAFGKRA